MSYPFPMYSGILEPKHYKRIGSAIWLFLWCVSSTTKEIEKNGEKWGVVLGNKPLNIIRDIAPVFDVSERTIRQWIKSLEKFQYIETKRTPRGLIFLVRKSKKFKNKTEENFRTDDSERKKTSEQKPSDRKNFSECSEENFRSNKDITKINNNTTTITTQIDVEKIATKFCQLKSERNGKVCKPTKNDYQVIAQIVALGVPTSITIKLLEEGFARNQQKKINAFSYFYEYIIENYEAIKAKENAQNIVPIAPTQEPTPRPEQPKPYRQFNNHYDRQQYNRRKALLLGNTQRERDVDESDGMTAEEIEKLREETEKAIQELLSK